MSVFFSFSFLAYLVATCALSQHQHGLFLPRCPHLAFICGEISLGDIVLRGCARDRSTRDIFPAMSSKRRADNGVWSKRGAVDRHSRPSALMNITLAAGERRLTSLFTNRYFDLVFKVCVLILLPWKHHEKNKPRKIDMKADYNVMFTIRHWSGSVLMSEEALLYLQYFCPLFLFLLNASRGHWITTKEKKRGQIKQLEQLRSLAVHWNTLRINVGKYRTHNV